jgi:hypothetical protein
VVLGSYAVESLSLTILQEEIDHCRSRLYSGIAESAVADVYAWWGGVPRMVLETLAKELRGGQPVESLQIMLKALIDRVDLHLVQASLGGLTIRTDTNQSLSHYV